MVNIEGEIKKIVKPITDELEGAIKEIPKIFKPPLDTIENALQTAGEEIEKGLNIALDEAVKKPIGELTSGIDVMLHNIIRIICFMNKMPCRFRNLFATFDNLFKGIIEEFSALGQAMDLGFANNSSLIYYLSIFIGSYIQCMRQLAQNMLFCLPFFLLQIFGQILYLPIRLILWIFSTYLYINLYAIEARVWKGLQTVDDALFRIFQIHIIHFPKSVRESCFTCIRLKESAVRNRNRSKKDTDREARDIITNKDGKRQKIPQAFKHFQEVFRFQDARPPERVPRVKWPESFAELLRNFNS